MSCACVRVCVCIYRRMCVYTCSHFCPLLPQSREPHLLLCARRVRLSKMDRSHIVVRHGELVIHAGIVALPRVLADLGSASHRHVGSDVATVADVAAAVLKSESASARSLRLRGLRDVHYH